MRRKMLKLTHLVLGLALVLGLFGPVWGAADPAEARAHPLLLQMATEDPDQQVAVIVQKRAREADYTALVAQLGGEITKDLHMINAFVVELPAGAALELARHPIVHWVSLDAVVEKAGKPVRTTSSESSTYSNSYIDTLGVKGVWGLGLQGEGISVAVIDSGIFMDRDFNTSSKKPTSRIIWQESFSTNSFKTDDATGHGTHVAGIIAGNGGSSDGIFAGIAPKVNIINLKVSDETGAAYESDVVAAIQWVLDNKQTFNIRVVNLSINSMIESSYHTSPLDAAVEILWFNGIVVVASVGNKTASDNYNPAKAAPANDPFIITVGASDERGSPDFLDDRIATFSARGITADGYAKPDIVAPGEGIISVLSDGSNWDLEYPDRVILGGEYFRLSGTSMAAPMVTGAVVLLLQNEPDLTPDQVKYRLLNSTQRLLSDDVGDQYPYLDIYATILGNTTDSANTNLTASQLLWTGDDPLTWGSVAWNSVAWNSVAWNSVAWNSVAWNSVAWNSVYWGQ